MIIESPFGQPKITKDGVTVAKAIEFSDRYQNLGANLVKSVASKTNDVAGDGTTTATILTRAIFEEGCKRVAAGVNPMDLRRGVTMAVERVVKQLQEMSKKVESRDEIKQVGTISANNDAAIGELLASAMERVGRDGLIEVVDGKGVENEIEVVEGMDFNEGYLSHHFVTDRKQMCWQAEDASVLIVDSKINNVHALLPILDQVVAARKKLLIISPEGMDSEPLTALIINKTRGLNVAAVKAPGFGDHRIAQLQDMAVLTGAELVSEEVGLKLEDVTLNQLGSAKKITVFQDRTIILGGNGDPAAIQARCESIRESLSRTTSNYEKEKLQARLGKLSGGVALIKVGGNSEVEVGEVKDRIVDALNATKAAVEQGIVPGGGTALLYASKIALDNLKVDNFDQQVGIDIVRKACQTPCRLICSNAGVEGALIVNQLLQQNDMKRGFNAQNLEFTDMVKAGIIDPTKVVRTAITDASSVASLLTTTEALICDEPDKPGDNAGSGMNPMGGMGMGMGGGMF